MPDYRDSYSLDVKGQQALALLLQTIDDTTAAYKRGLMGPREYEKEITRLQQAIDRLHDTQQKKPPSQPIDDVGKSAKRSNMAIIEFARGLQDFAAAGVMGATNNIQRLAEVMGGSGKLVLGTTIAALAVEHLFKNWEQYFPKTEKYATNVEKLKKQLEDLEKTKAKVTVDGTSVEAVRKQLEELESSLSAFKAAAQTPSEEEATQAAGFRQAVFQSGGAQKLVEQVLQAAHDAGSPLNQNQALAIQKVQEFEKDLKHAKEEYESLSSPEMGSAMGPGIGPALTTAAMKVANTKEALEGWKIKLKEASVEAAQEIIGAGLRGRSSELVTIQDLQRRFPQRFDPKFGAVQDVLASRQRELAFAAERQRKNVEDEDTLTNELHDRANQIASQMAKAFEFELRKQILEGKGKDDLEKGIRAQLQAGGYEDDEATIAAAAIVKAERDRVKARQAELEIGGKLAPDKARERILKDDAERQAQLADPERKQREQEQKAAEEKAKREREAAINKLVGQYDQAYAPKVRQSLVRPGVAPQEVQDFVAKGITKQGEDPAMAGEAAKRIVDREQAKLKGDRAALGAFDVPEDQIDQQLQQQANLKGLGPFAQQGQALAKQLEPTYGALATNELLSGANPAAVQGRMQQALVQQGVDPRVAEAASIATLERENRELQEKIRAWQAAGLTAQQRTISAYASLGQEFVKMTRDQQTFVSQFANTNRWIYSLMQQQQMQGWSQAPVVWPR